MLILPVKTLVTVNVLYYRLDYAHLLNEFLWQTMDTVPEYPRIHKFLEHWRKEVKAVIKEVSVCYDSSASFRPIDALLQ
jgi:uncharacterized protein Usg